MKIYLAGRFVNKGILQGVRDDLLRWGHIVTSRWLDGDGATPVDTAQMDLADIDSADALVLYFDRPKKIERPMAGAYIEFGYALAKGKKLVIVYDSVPEHHIFFQLPEVITVLGLDQGLREVLALVAAQPVPVAEDWGYFVSVQPSDWNHGV